MKNFWCAFVGELSEQTVEEIIVESNKYEYQKAEVGKSKELIENPKIRRSDIKFLHTYNSKHIADLLMYYVRIANKTDFGFDIDGVQDMQYTEYDSSYDGFYDWHVDTEWCDSAYMFQRKISVTVQLSDSDEYEGGDFEIRNTEWNTFLESLPEGGIRKKGTIIIFPSFVTHRVTPVTKGKRKSLVSWIDGSAFR